MRKKSGLALYVSKTLKKKRKHSALQKYTYKRLYTPLSVKKRIITPSNRLTRTPNRLKCPFSSNRIRLFSSSLPWTTTPPPPQHKNSGSEHVTLALILLWLAPPCPTKSSNEWNFVKTSNVSCSIIFNHTCIIHQSLVTMAQATEQERNSWAILPHLYFCIVSTVWGKCQWFINLGKHVSAM